ncbi:hypothetical protein SAMN05660649_02706 [Desulfotomaculum arcticum]|uniref:Uncharacterized protein n=1 Tax=Desulfotruncus arcticus DSM 17038 TaxID=1121424 RepID=A0A1I2UMU3_9FIRM|nr:hypothetical protein [Desulfotruncus arcticus]SFG78350.1 hypothetical protein SAMN05660649_02706 [Desulfotomaculum arcticum] [Desulfotruncus arcticus DSM 17038]
MLLNRASDAITLGSLLPDMIISKNFNHIQAHSIGHELWQVIGKDSEMNDLALGAISHGITPKGLDYFGDEQYSGFERGYCFEKGRLLVEETVAACNIPPQMGWWKAHNIVEMGIELRISALGNYGNTIHRAFSNVALITRLGEILPGLTGSSDHHIKSRLSGFTGYIDTSKATPMSLAQKYNFQMFIRHKINIDIPKVARLIELAAGYIDNDIDDFFRVVRKQVYNEIKSLD